MIKLDFSHIGQQFISPWQPYFITCSGCFIFMSTFIIELLSLGLCLIWQQLAYSVKISVQYCKIELAVKTNNSGTPFYYLSSFLRNKPTRQSPALHRQMKHKLICQVCIFELSQSGVKVISNPLHLGIIILCLFNCWLTNDIE